MREEEQSQQSDKQQGDMQQEEGRNLRGQFTQGSTAARESGRQGGHHRGNR